MAYKNSTLDETDLRLLNILWNSGRATLAEMGKECGLSAPGVADRLRRLERNGVILGYAPRIGLAAPDRVTWTMQLQIQPPDFVRLYQRVNRIALTVAGAVVGIALLRQLVRRQRARRLKS